MAALKKLNKAPLQEVIFEILWDIEYDSKGVHHDPGFNLAQGIFAKEMSGGFPVLKKKIPDELIGKIYPFTAYQFWKKEGVWPVVQFGPGILAVNETDTNYDWDDSFYPLIINSLQLLEKSYSKKLSYKKFSLRYIDAVDLNGSEIISFVNQNFKVRLENNYETFGNPITVNFSQTFKINETFSLNFSITNGLNTKKKNSVVWQTTIFSEGRYSIEQVIALVQEAHEHARQTFKKTVTDEFYSTFI